MRIHVSPQAGVTHFGLLLFFSFSFLGSVQAAIPNFEGIECGISRSRDIRKELRQPTKALASDKYIERYECLDRGIVTADVVYDDHGPVSWARIRFVKQMAPSTVALIFWQIDTPRIVQQGQESIHHYDNGGVHLEVRNQLVTQAWMTLPNVDLQNVKAEAKELLRSLGPQTPPPPPRPSKPKLSKAAPTLKKPPGIPLKITVTNKPGGSMRMNQVSIKEVTDPKTGKGITLHIKGTATGKANSFVTALAKFRFAQGGPVEADGPNPERWQNSEGAFMASTQVFCERSPQTWENLTISIPYRQLKLAPGSHSLILDLSLGSGSSKNVIAQPLLLIIPEQL